MLDIVDSVGAWRRTRARLTGRTIGFVPTMGALHEGHVSLIRRSASENDVTVVSVFVNPAQFDEAADLDVYPRTLDADRALAESAGADLLLAPSADDLYPDGYAYRVGETSLSRELCGAHRPGHFEGVLTVVLKLLQLVRPDVAYFGEKDFQQLQLVRGMVDAFFLDVEIRAGSTVRESSGLALSSRNARLAPAERERAAAFPRALSECTTSDAAARRLRAAGIDVEYVEDRWGRRLGAVRVGGVRLIDNVALGRPEEENEIR